MTQDNYKAPAVSADEFTSFIDAVHSGFKRSCTTPFNRHVQIGPLSLKLSFAGPARMKPTMEALRHLETHADSTPDFSIALIDSESTGINLPHPPSGMKLHRGVVCGHEDQSMQLCFETETAAFSMIDFKQKTALSWISSTSAIPFYEQAAPLRVIFHLLLRHCNVQFLHAAGVATKDAGVLIGGKGGSGKSTTALACLNSGLLYAGDDYIAVQRQAPITAHSIYNSAKFSESSLSLLSEESALEASIENPSKTPEEKFFLFINKYKPDLISNSFPVRAVLLPHVVDSARSQLTRATASEVLMSLAPSTMYQLIASNQDDLRGIRQIAESVPGYHLTLGRDFERIAEIISNFLMPEGNPLP
jgi:hypothetical protein